MLFYGYYQKKLLFQLGHLLILPVGDKKPATNKQECCHVMTIMEFPVFIEISGRKRVLAYFFRRSGGRKV